MRVRGWGTHDSYTTSTIVFIIIANTVFKASIIIATTVFKASIIITTTVFKHPLLLPACASEQGNVIGLVSVHIYICVCVRIFF